MRKREFRLGRTVAIAAAMASLSGGAALITTQAQAQAVDENAGTWYVMKTDLSESSCRVLYDWFMNGGHPADCDQASGGDNPTADDWILSVFLREGESVTIPGDLVP